VSCINGSWIHLLFEYIGDHSFSKYVSKGEGDTVNVIGETPVLNKNFPNMKQGFSLH